MLISCNQVKQKESQLIRRKKIVQTSNDQLKSLQELVETELADNKHSEYLLRLFASRESVTLTKSQNTQREDVDKDKLLPVDKSKLHNPSSLDELKMELKAGVGGMKHPGKNGLKII